MRLHWTINEKGEINKVPDELMKELVTVVNPEDLDKINQISENYQFFKEIRKTVNNYNKRFRRDFADLLRDNK